MSQFHFIAGLPRSGSTLLSSILRQNPRFQASIMSPVNKIVSSLLSSWQSGTEIAPLVNTEQRRRLIKAMFTEYHHAEDSVVFDSNRGWAEKLPLLDDLYPEAKVICCVRNIAWVLDSFEKLYLKDPYENTRLFSNADDRSTVYTRVKTMARPNRTVGYAAQALKQAFYSDLSDKLILLDFDYLTTEPEQAIRALYRSLGEPYFDHDFDNVEFGAKEFDENLGIPGLHDVRKKIAPLKRNSVLPPDLFNEFSHSSFWLNPAGTKAQFIAPIKNSKSTK